MKAATMKPPHHIIPREKLDFDLAGDIPRHWFGGDPFKTRYFDAMSTLFPEGERFFISSVRAYRDQVTDLQLLQEIQDFMRQEGQHGMVHTQYNKRLRAQGINVDKLEGILRHLFVNIAQKYAPKAQSLAETAATEHMTAIMAHCLFTNKKVMGPADKRVRAMYAWHAIEEVEHKSVAFDVMQKVAKVGYARRAMALLSVTLGFNLYALGVAAYMLKADGFSLWQRVKMMSKGVLWLYAPGGLYMPIMGHYLAYFKPGFHPWKSGELKGYQTWMTTFDRTGDPIQAGEMLYAAAD
ncbi:MAG: metal-dependent hydrolase [Burkholderiales bacterium]|jgi:predicted metal-dependent hydrolase|nr:MAG: metal-dependent hydrolase [Burkholderiales bacterium]